LVFQLKTSVIIPTLNEAGCLAGTLKAVREQQPHEIIVVDGGSTDGTMAQAGQDVQVLSSARGRAVQMNAGAARATGDLLFFLHADCTLEQGALAEAARALARRHVAACCFTMRVSADGRLYRLIDACATARVWLTGLIYGDQGLVVRRRDFEELGGFPPLRFMEDLFFSRRLRSLGRTLVLPRRIWVSPRRWQRAGLVRQTLRNWTLTALAAGGISPDGLARFYPEVR
jgi:rSAM/selenodomain-associated transferase 2